MKQVYFFDTTLRDGIQAPGNFIPLEKRVKIARIIEDVGVDIIEIGYPASSDYEKKVVRALYKKLKKVCIFSRCNRDDIQIARESCQSENSEIELLVSGSDTLLQYKVRKSRDENVAEMLSSISYARTLFPYVSVVIEDSGRADQQYINSLVRNAVAAGISKIVIADTTGHCLPEGYGKIIRNVKKIAHGVRVSAHCHNDLGLAVANSLSALVNGADEIQTTFLGMGERTGNTAFHTLLMALTVRSEVFQYVHDVDIKKIYEASRKIARLLGREISKEEPLIGTNAFSTEAGMHQASLLSHQSTYEVIDPSIVGRKREISIGPYSGRNAIAKKCVDLGFRVSPQELKELTVAIKSRTKSLNESELIELIKGVK